MATIILQRTNEYINRLRDYQIYIDEQKVGTIANGETKEFEVSNEQHTIVAKIDWCSSPTVTVNLNNLLTQHIKVGGFKNGNWLIPTALILSVLSSILIFYIGSKWTLLITTPFFGLFAYYLTIGRKKYLTLTVLS